VSNPASNSAVGICNAALLLIGAEEINSFEDETREAKVCNTLYPLERDALIVCHPWKFTVGWQLLSRLNETPVHTDWQYAYSLPPDCLEVLADTTRNEYRLGEGNRLYSNRDSVILQYQLQPDETRFSSAFRLALVYKMGASLSVSLNEDLSKRKELLEGFRLQMRQARYQDSKQQPPIPLPLGAYAIVAARMVGV
jgi:hypothetical protein